MFKKLLSSIGLGGAKVNLILDRQDYRMGEPVNGRFIITPGSTEQHVQKIYVHFMMEAKHEQEIHHHRVDSVSLPGFHLRAGGPPVEIPFQYAIPWHIPITRPGIRHYFASGLDIDNAVDPSDKDYVTIHPDPAMDTVMRSLASLGFQEKWASGSLDSHGQEFEYAPTSFLRDRISELEIYFVHDQEGLRLYMELDKRARGLSGLIAAQLDLNEKKAHLFIPYNQIDRVAPDQIAHTAALLQNFLQQELNSPGFSSHGSHPPHSPYGHGNHGHGRHRHGHGHGAGAAAGILGGLAIGELLDGDDDGDDDGGGFFDFGGGDDGGFFGGDE